MDRFVLSFIPELDGGWVFSRRSRLEERRGVLDKGNGLFLRWGFVNIPGILDKNSIQGVLGESLSKKKKEDDQCPVEV